MKQNWKEYSTQYPSVRYKKVVRTLELCLTRSKYFLGANVDDDLLDTIAKVEDGKLFIRSGRWHELYQHLYELDAAIRYADDVIDEDLVGRNNIDFAKIGEVIEDFERECPEAAAANVGLLYWNELKVWQSEGKTLEEREKDIMDHVKVRMIDLMFLMQTIVGHVGSELSDPEMAVAWEMLRNWEEIDALVTDIRGLREDRLRNSYNVLIFANRNGVRLTEISDHLNICLQNIEECARSLDGHPHQDFITNAINNTKLVLNNLYLPWLEAYEQNEEEWLKGIGSTLI